MNRRFVLLKEISRIHDETNRHKFSLTGGFLSLNSS